MYTILARISLQIEVTKEELEKFIENKDTYEYELPSEIIERFLKNGTVAEDSYIPEEQYEWRDIYEPNNTK